VIKLLELEVKVGGEKKVIIRTHERPHFDEIVAKWLIEKFADEEFLKRYAQGGIIEVGIGGGPFDEHQKGNKKKGQEECAATLVAKALGIEDDPALKKLLHFTVTVDQKGGAQPFDVSSITKVLHERFPQEPQKVIKWTEMAIEAKYFEQSQFFRKAKEEFESKAKTQWVKTSKGKVKMVTVVSDLPETVKYALSISGGQAGVVIIQNTSGNVQIFTSKRFGLKLSELARIIRIEEQKAKGKILIRDWKKLESEEVEEIKEWFYFQKGEMLLNGSLTAPDVPPTRLSLKKIEELVKIGLNPQTFEPSRAEICRSGICSSTRKDPCPWYKWGLYRCRRLRYRQATRYNY